MSGMARQPVLGTLSTGRLVLRPSRPEDASVYRRLWTERDPRVPPRRRVDRDGRPTAAEIVSDIRAEAAGSADAYRLLAVELRDTREVIGYCGLVTGGVTFSDGSSPTEPELAYEFLRSTHGFGYATEAGRVVVDWAAGTDHQRLWASVRDWNIASRRVLDKLGFRDTGDREPDDGFGDSLITMRTG